MYQREQEQQTELEERLKTIRSNAMRLQQLTALDGEQQALLSRIIKESTQASDLVTGMLSLADKYVD